VNTENPKVLKELTQVKYIEPNYQYKIFDYTKTEAFDPKFEQQWALQNLGHNEPVRVDRMSPLDGKIGCDIGATQVWQQTLGSKDIVVAVIDTGISYNHPDLKDNIWINQAEKDGRPGVDDDGNGFIDDIYGYDFANSDSDPLDDNGHGTHCAGIIGAAHNGQGVMGVLPNVSLVAIKSTNKKGYLSTETAIKAMEYALKTPATVFSCSWGGSDHSLILKDLIKRAGERGVIVVAAAGNSRGRNNDTSPTYPASYKLDNVIAVGAHNAQGYYSNFSTRGPNSIHLAAPGTNIISTWLKGKYKVASGTSMAAPMVSAAVALLQYLEPSLSPKEIRQRLMDTGVKESALRSKVISGARLNLLNAIK
jgi:subtilisin family serine protease